MEYLLFVLYLVFFAWLVTKTKFFAGSGISRSQLIIIFLLKVMAGIFYGWMGIYYGGLAQMSDTWHFHKLGLYEYHLLGTNPAEYFTNLFNNPYNDGLGNFFASNDSYWNDLKSNAFVKILSIFDVFSFGYYYVNIIFYSFFTLFGPVALYRVMKDVYPGRRKPLFFAIFMIPSFLYWTSGLHKEGLIFVCLAFIIYIIYFANKQKRISARHWIIVACCFIAVMILRNILVAILLPACLAWLIANRWPRRRAAIFSFLYIFCIAIFFCSKYIDPRLDFPQSVVDKQQDFLKLSGGRTNVPINQVAPNFGSFIENTPQAVALSMLRPYPADVIHLPSLGASIEVCLLLLLLLLFIFFHRRNAAPVNTLVYFCLFFSFSLLLAIGFSNNNLGSICRYRSIVLPLLVAPMAANIQWNRVIALVSGETDKKQDIH